MRFGKSKGEFERVEMMMTPMIDVCFQMIIFFIANMRLFTPEGDFNIAMPLAGPREGIAGESQIPPIKIRLRADADGNLAAIQMGQRTLRSFRDLRGEIRQICGVDRGPTAVSATAEAQLDFDYHLKYEYVVDAVSAVSGYLAADGQTVVPLIEKIKFGPLRRSASD